jgi:hypothetical protein
VCHVQNPPNGTNPYSFALKRPKSPKLDKSLFFWPDTTKIQKPVEILILLLLNVQNPPN